MMFHGFWSVLALINYAGIGQGIESGGIYFIEAVGSYLMARCYINSIKTFRYAALAMVSIVTSLLAFVVFESVTGFHLIREIFRAVLGGPSLPFIDPRLGLHRAFGSFEHPILYGIFCSSTFGLVVYLNSSKGQFYKYLIKVFIVLSATFFSLSSGAFSALGAQFFLVAWEKGTRNIGQRWMILLSIFAMFWTSISLVSNRSPVKVFLTYFTFNPGTAYNRLRIWEYGTAEVGRHPIFGIGLGDWERPAWMISGSMDNFWLATTVRYGIPAFIGLAGACVILITVIAMKRAKSNDFHQARYGWIFSVCGLALAGSTVHFWNALFCLFCFLIGMGTVLYRSRG